MGAPSPDRASYMYINIYKIRVTTARLDKLIASCRQWILLVKFEISKINS